MLVQTVTSSTYNSGEKSIPFPTNSVANYNTVCDRETFFSTLTEMSIRRFIRNSSFKNKIHCNHSFISKLEINTLAVPCYNPDST